MKYCTIKDCTKELKARGMCSAHWYHWYKTTPAGIESNKKQLEKLNAKYDTPEYQAKLKAYKSTPEYKAAHTEYRRAYEQTDKYKAIKKAYHRSDKYKEIAAAYRKTDARKEAQARYYASTKGKACAARSTAKRIERLQAATPAWADVEAIKKFYNECPVGYVIDHVFPLQGETVSGLHVLNNLQYLPRKINAAKGNKFNP